MPCFVTTAAISLSPSDVLSYMNAWSKRAMIVSSHICFRSLKSITMSAVDSGG